MRKKVFILTSGEGKLAADCICNVYNSENYEFLGVIQSKGMNPDTKKRRIKNKILKIFEIGLLGAINGIFLRAWYDWETEKLSDVCTKYKIALYQVPYINSYETRKVLRALNADLGISLGNPYIHKDVYSIPTDGMINLHCERLPQYQNAQSVIWPIYNNERTMGYCFHKINKFIDQGDIIFQKTFRIEFHRRLRETVTFNFYRIRKDVQATLDEVVTNYLTGQYEAVAQKATSYYTTPDIISFLQMIIKNHKFFYRNVK